MQCLKTNGKPLGFRAPNGVRTRVTAVKGRCPRPLDDGDVRTEGKGIGERGQGKTTLIGTGHP